MTYGCCHPERARDLSRPEEMLHCVQHDKRFEFEFETAGLFVGGS
jgi:hypothetical protein